jgi:hypothetical protein
VIFRSPVVALLPVVLITVVYRTLRSARYTLLAMLVLALRFAVLFSAGAGNMWTKRPPADQVGLDPASISLQGGVLLAHLAMGSGPTAFLRT